MNKKLLFPAAILALVLAGAGCNKAGKLSEPSKTPLPTGPVELKLKWPQGERVVQNMDVKSKTETAIPGRPEPMQQNTTMGQKYALTVLKENSDGGHEVEMEFLSARMGIEMGGKKLVNYDSAKPSAADATNPVAGMFGKIVGSKLKFIMNSSNMVERIDGVDEMMNRLSAGMPAASLGTLKGMYSEGYFKQMMSSARFMPSKAVSPGDTWPVHLEMPMEPLGILVMDYNVSLQGWEKHGQRNCARMEFTGTIKSMPGSATQPAMMGMSMTMKDGNSTGTTWFDPELGIAIDTTMNQDMTMTITLPKNPKAKTGPASQPQTLTTRINQEVDIKLDSLN